MEGSVLSLRYYISSIFIAGKAIMQTASWEDLPPSPQVWHKGEVVSRLKSGT
jgi:hypothetical protein